MAMVFDPEVSLLLEIAAHTALLSQDNLLDTSTLREKLAALWTQYDQTYGCFRHNTRWTKSLL